MASRTNDEKTVVLYDGAEMFRITIEDFSNLKETVDICGDHHGPSMFVNIRLLWPLFMQLTKRGIRVRFLTEITKENLVYSKELMKFAELRHLDNIKFGGFGIFDGTKYRCSPTSKGEGSPPEFIMSNVKELVEEQTFVFDTLWSRAIPVKQRIKEIEEDAKREFVETLREPIESHRLLFNLVNSAQEEILLLFSTPNAFHRLEHLGLFSLILEAAGHRNVIVRILVAMDDKIQKIQKKVDNAKEKLSINFHALDKGRRPNVTTLLVDMEYSLVVDIKDDSKENFEEAIGLSTYSNNESTIATYTSIFEMLWMQIELHEPKNR
jgi:hypothetical protein